jgi:hypothetical protein
MSKLPQNLDIIAYATPRDRARISALALSSAILGILACAPAVFWIMAPFADRRDWGFLILMTLPVELAPISLFAGLAALLTSLVAIRAIRKAARRGCKLAIGGLVLGIVTTVGWGGLCSIRVYAATTAYLRARAPKSAAIQFLNDLSKSPESAATDCDSGVALSDLSFATDQIQHWGGVGNLTTDHFQIDSNPPAEAPSCVLEVSVDAPNGRHFFAIRLRKLNGAWKVYWYRFN